MINKLVIRTISASIIMLIIVVSTGCTSSRRPHPAASMQKALASRLADSASCPSGNSDDVQRIVDENPGGLVLIPEGCYRMNATIVLPPGTQMEGAGAEKTVFYRDPAMTFSQPIVHVRGGADAPGGTRISAIAFIGVRDSDDAGQDFGLRFSDAADFRVDHCYFEGFGFAGVQIEGDSNGVVDHSIFIDNYQRAINNLGYGVAVYGSGNWLADPQPGSDQAAFIEDSLFIGNRHAVAASAGAHYVFRHNQVLRSVVACAVDAHGMGYGSNHGTRYVEIYRNTISDPVDDWCGIGIRGGAGVIFENTIEGYQNPILLILEWGTPDQLKAEYPARDQIQDLYIWDNQIKKGPADPQVDETGVGFIQAGRDYFLEAKPGYTPYPYPHPLVGGNAFDGQSWPPEVE